MRNNFTILLISVFILSCGINSYAAEVSPQAKETAAFEAGAHQDDPTAEAPDIIEANLSDLAALEKGIRDVEDKFEKRKEKNKVFAEYERMRQVEMKKCDELRNEIWKLRDSIKASIARQRRLAGDKSKSEEGLAALTELVKAREEDVKSARSGVSDAEAQFKSLMEADGKKNDEWAKKIDEIRDGLRSADDKIKSLQAEKAKIDGDLAAQDAEYKSRSEKLKALRDKPSPEKQEDASAKLEAAKLEKGMKDLLTMAEEWETAKQKLSEEILAISAAKRAKEDEITVINKEADLEEEDLKSRAEALEKNKKEAGSNIEKLKTKAISARSKLLAASAADKKLGEDIEKAVEARHLLEKELNTKTGELKTRIAVLLGEDERDNPLNSSDRKKGIKEGSSRSAELNAKLESVFGSMKDENDRLIAENKTAQVKLRQAEQAAKAARRKAEQSAKAPKELKVKMDRERIDMHFNLAVTYEKSGLYRDAEREYLKCLKIDPRDSGVHYNLGILYDDKLNRNNKALYHYNKFLALRPMGDSAERVRDWITKIELENRIGKEMR